MNSGGDIFSYLLKDTRLSLMKCLFKFFAHLKNWFVRLFTVDLGVLYALNINVSRVNMLEIISPIQCPVFYLLMVSCDEQKSSFQFGPIHKSCLVKITWMRLKTLNL